MKAGRVEVTARADAWTLRTARPPETKAPDASRAELAAMLRLPEDAMGDHPLWVDTGAQQLVLPLARPEHVREARPDADLIARHAFSPVRRQAMAYVWARESADTVVARFFFLSGAVLEDPATGSACANLGGWMLATGAPVPVACACTRARP